MELRDVGGLASRQSNENGRSSLCIAAVLSRLCEEFLIVTFILAYGNNKSSFCNSLNGNTVDRPTRMEKFFSVVRFPTNPPNKEQSSKTNCMVTTSKEPLPTS